MPIQIQKAATESLEYQAYEIVKDIETIEPNGQNRLAYHIFLFMKNDYPSLEEAVRIAKANLKEPQPVVLERIAERLREKGYSV